MADTRLTRIAARRISRFRKPPAVILGAADNGLSFLRSLGRRGIPVVALGSRNENGLFSRYGFPLIVPDPVTNEDALAQSMQELGEALPTRAVLIPTGDAFALFVSKHAGLLEKVFDFNVADYETITALTNKKLQYEYARGQGLATPTTYYPRDVSLEDIARSVRYPCLLKPCIAHLWRQYRMQHGLMGLGKAMEARSPSELIQTHNRVENSGVEMMVQEKIGGGEDRLWSVLAYFNRASDTLAVFTKRKLRQYPLDYGDGCFQVSAWDAEVAELGVRFLRGLKYRGNAGVEFKRDPEDGMLKLMEVNPRSLAATHIAVSSGVDLPFIAYADSRGDPVAPAATFRDGVKWINFEKDLKAFREHRRRGDLDLSHWVKSWQGERCYAYFAWDDPLPACVGFLRLLQSGLRAPAMTASS